MLKTETVGDSWQARSGLTVRARQKPAVCFSWTMIRFAASLSIAVFFAALARAVTPVLLVENERIPSPAPVGAHQSSLSRASEHEVFVAWTEPGENGDTLLRRAHFDQKKNHWDMPMLMARGTGIDAVTMVGGVNQLAAGWYERSTDSTTEKNPIFRLKIVRTSVTDAGGSPETLLETRDKSALLALARARDDGFLTAWTDAHSLHGRRLQTTGRDEPLSFTLPDRIPALIEAIALAGFRDGRRILALRDRTADQRAEIHVSHFDGTTWSSPAALATDVGALPSRARRGLVVAAEDGRAIVVWYSVDHTGAPQLFAATSENAGEQFLLPKRIDDGHPTSDASAVILHDGIAFVSWAEVSPSSPHEAALWLRRISPGGELSVPALLGSTVASAPAPQLAVLNDVENEPVQLIVAYDTGGETGQVATHRLSISRPDPTGKTERPCNCPDDDASSRGAPIHGRIVKIDTERRQVEIIHDAVPGVLSAGRDRFDVDALSPALRAELELFGRVERHGTGWRIFDLQLRSPATP